MQQQVVAFSFVLLCCGFVALPPILCQLKRDQLSVIHCSRTIFSRNLSGLVTLHLMYVQILRSKLLNGHLLEKLPTWLTLCSLSIMYICNLSFFPFWF